jgi:hypothetical protein
MFYIYIASFHICRDGGYILLTGSFNAIIRALNQFKFKEQLLIDPSLLKAILLPSILLFKIPFVNNFASIFK